MVLLKASNIVFVLLAAGAWSPAASDLLREPAAQRIRNPNSSTVQSSVMEKLPKYQKFFKSLAASPFIALKQLSQMHADMDAEMGEQKDDMDALAETFEAIVMADMMSMGPTPSPSVSASPSTVPTEAPSGQPSASPSAAPSKAPSNETSAPTISTSPTSAPSASPTKAPTTTNSAAPTGSTTNAPTMAPTEENCGISTTERVTRILAVLDANANAELIRNNDFAQGKATTWLLSEDEYQVCPDDPKILQRWALAVAYYSTGGDSWFQCSANPSAIDGCGSVEPFLNKDRFLSSSNECDWAGISCIDGCVTEVEFEENNLVGTIPSEMALLTDLLIWGMERGGLSSSIPTEIGLLSNLIFLDLDYNELTGSLTSELLSLSSLTQLDLNNNQLTGSINGIGVFPNMEFLQLHDNYFTGTVPDTVGSFSNLAAFTLHETDITGSMPESVCDLLVVAGNGGVLDSLIADCGSEPNPEIVCLCCTDCRDTF